MKPKLRYNLYWIVSVEKNWVESYREINVFGWMFITKKPLPQRALPSKSEDKSGKNPLNRFFTVCRMKMKEEWLVLAKTYASNLKINGCTLLFLLVIELRSSKINP